MHSHSLSPCACALAFSISRNRCSGVIGSSKSQRRTELAHRQEHGNDCGRGERVPPSPIPRKPATSTGIGLEMEDRPIYAATYRVGGGPVRHEPHPPHGWLKEVSLGQPAHARRCARTPAESNPKPQTPPFPSPSARRSSDPRMMFVFLRAKPLTEARCPSDKLGSSTAKGCGRAPSRKKPWAPKEPKCVDEEASPAFSHQIRGGHRVWNARQSPQRSRRDGRRAWPCR